MLENQDNTQVITQEYLKSFTVIDGCEIYEVLSVYKREMRESWTQINESLVSLIKYKFYQKVRKG